MFKPDQKPPQIKIESMESVNLIVAPAGESLLYPGQKDSLWSNEINNNKELIEQAKLRQNLSNHFDSLSSVPYTMEIKEILEKKLLSTEKATDMYNDLSTLIESDPYNNRLVLYFPFELLPQKDTGVENKELSQSINNFANIYIEKWKELLYVNDFRASFVDGDLPEPEIRNEPHEKVNKAAHLIPIIVKKNLITFSDVIKIMEDSDDKVLKNSIADTLPVLNDMGLISENDFNLILNSKETLVRNMYPIIKANEGNTNNVEADKNIYDKNWLNGINNEIEKDLNLSEEKQEKFSNFTKERIAWIKQENLKKLINKYSNGLFKGIENDSLSLKDIQEWIMVNEAAIPKQIAIDSIHKYIENKATISIKGAQESLEKFESILQNLQNESIPEVEDLLISTWSRFASIGIIDDKYIDKNNIKIQRIDTPFFSNNKKETVEEINYISKITESIENNTELSKYVYPISIVYGSKIKGYGTKNSDTDIALFIKPNVSNNEKTNIRKLLNKTFTEKSIDGKALEFWLKNEGGELKIQDIENSDERQASSATISVLLEGVWCGKKEAIKELYEKLLPGFLYSQDKKIGNVDARKIWMKELERDTLQYRLLHKGYARLNIEQGGIKTKNTKDIDGDSMFWDSGYRRLATKLFITKVFLPILKAD